MNGTQHSAVAQVLGSAQSVDFPHLLVVALFMFVVRIDTSYLPISVPAFLLAIYHEWTLVEKNDESTIKYSLSSIFICWFGTFAYRLAKRRLKAHELPGPPHNIVLGHLPTLAKESPKLPFDGHSHLLMNHLADEYNLRESGLFYMDVYPISQSPMLVVTSPEVASQVTQAEMYGYAKHPALQNFKAVLGERGIVSQEGAKWKVLRTMFNPGFSQANLFSMVPMIVDETNIFMSRLSKSAKADGFVESIEMLAAELTVDIIGQALFGLKFNSQTSMNPLVDSIIQSSRNVVTASDLSPQHLNVWKMMKLKYYEIVANKQLMKVLRTRWSELDSSPEKAAQSHAIFDIAMATYMKKEGKVEATMTTDFLELMRDNVKTFIFAGHDTTSSVLAYSFYELSRHPEILEEVRAEHESILGSDPNEAAGRLTEDPKLANALRLTAAVVRETMRLYLPATSVRIGPPGGTVTGTDGKTYSTEGYLVWLNNVILMHDPKVFPKPYEFIPNRFLPDKSPFSPIPKNAFRPFEKGPRDCIGQELAMLEAKVVLALVLRKFDFKEAYGELDLRLGRTVEKPTVETERIGGRAYQILWTTAKPKDGIPMWVKERGIKSG
ncbi:Aflatoxin biosynthesis N [Hyphodiscus hymeniophilus]|uniref:Aflatoxin biosynthesis N n=1 Tax=Hyphodiscus hymeniophilus TaxID=353542 RepID=A0A9P6VNE1_9HELO|nr:Aflatoxin biosynthesis N [Hyphodiscus hymeniophilus]